MSVFFPSFNVRLLPRMLGMACVGAIVAGCYGILHDQVTFSISREYFTKMKFEQFAAADFGFPERVFVGEIGFLATWWVGFIAAWFLARMAVPVWPGRMAWRKVFAAVSIMLAIAFVTAVIGYVIGGNPGVDGPFWRSMCERMEIRDVAAFVRVGYIHYASYLGGLIGLVVAVFLMNRWKKCGAGES